MREQYVDELLNTQVDEYAEAHFEMFDWLKSIGEVENPNDFVLFS